MNNLRPLQWEPAPGTRDGTIIAGPYLIRNIGKRRVVPMFNSKIIGVHSSFEEAKIDCEHHWKLNSSKEHTDA